jgi:hypothetical protein
MSNKYTLVLDQDSLRFNHHVPLVPWTQEDRECAEALEQVMIQLQKPSSRFEAIINDVLLPFDDSP